MINKNSKPTFCIKEEGAGNHIQKRISKPTELQSEERATPTMDTYG
jgi:hypothetical protein